MRIISRFFKKLTSWPLSKDPSDDALVYWVDEDREKFYKCIKNKRYADALDIIKDRATQHSMKEMADLMRAFEKDVVAADPKIDRMTLDEVDNEIWKVDEYLKQTHISDEDRMDKVLLRKKLEELKMWTMMLNAWDRKK